MGKQKISNGDEVVIPWDQVARLLHVMADYDGTSGTAIGRKLIGLLAPVADIIQAAQMDETAARFWCTKVAEWKHWQEQDECDRPDPLELCADFEDPTAAADFLSCPRLSEEKCARLFTGIDRPSNAYEKRVAMSQNPERQKNIMYYESKGPQYRVMLRLKMLRGGASFREIKRHLKVAKLLGFTLLDTGRYIHGASAEDVDRGIRYLIECPMSQIKLSRIA